MLKKIDLYACFFQKMRAYRRDFDQTKYMLLIKDGELLEKYNEIQEKVSNSIKKEFDREPIYIMKNI